jgi:hypothetical protein
MVILCRAYIKAMNALFALPCSKTFSRAIVVRPPHKQIVTVEKRKTTPTRSEHGNKRRIVDRPSTNLLLPNEKTKKKKKQQQHQSFAITLIAFKR